MKVFHLYSLFKANSVVFFVASFDMPACRDSGSSVPGQFILPLSSPAFKKRETAKIKKSFIQVPNLMQETTWENNKNTINITNKKSKHFDDYSTYFKLHKCEDVSIMHTLSSKGCEGKLTRAVNLPSLRFLCRVVSYALLQDWGITTCHKTWVSKVKSFCSFYLL